MANSIVQATYTAPVATNGVLTGDTDYYLNLTGASGSYASVPDSAALDLTGDIEILVRVGLTDWTSGTQTLLAKWGASGTYSYSLEISSTGFLKFHWSNNGTTDTTITSTSAVSFTDGTAYWIRVLFDADNGAAGNSCYFYTAPDNDYPPHVSFWTQLGSTVTTAGVATVYVSTSNLYVGAKSDGTNRATGKVYFAKVGTGSATATAVACMDFTRESASPFTDGKGNTVTVNAPASLEADSPWRFAVEALIASGGARVGKSHVGRARVSSYQWFDVTPYLQGVEWSRGKPPTVQGFPHADMGVCNLTLDNTDNMFSAWNDSYGAVTATGINTTYLQREWTPGAIFRVVMFKANAATTYTTDANNFSKVSRAGWQPLFTGIVEDHNEKITTGQNTVAVTLVEPGSLLAAITKPVASVGDGDLLAPRINRLTDGYWDFGIKDGNQYSNGDQTTTYIATTMSGNRWAEIQRSAESSQLYTTACIDTDGSILVFTPENTFNTTTLTQIGDAPLVHFVSSATAYAPDATTFENAYVGYYVNGLSLSHNMDQIVNDVSGSNGSTTQTASSDHSINLFGNRTFTKTDLLCKDAWLYIWAGQATAYDFYDATYTGQVDQTLQPGAVVLSDQQRAQRALRLHGSVVVDWNNEGASPVVRFVGRVSSFKHSIVRTTTGIVWTTTAQMFTRLNYLP